MKVVVHFARFLGAVCIAVQSDCNTKETDRPRVSDNLLEELPFASEPTITQMLTEKIEQYYRPKTLYQAYRTGDLAAAEEVLQPQNIINPK